MDYIEANADGDSLWRRNYASLSVFAEKVVEVLEDQSSRGQVLIMTEEAARLRLPNLTIASLGANKKDKSNGAVSARVLFDGTNGKAVNTRTRLRDAHSF